MPAMCYHGDHGTVCDTKIDSQAQEAYFIQRAKEFCEFFNETFEPARLRRYLPYWETGGKTAIQVERFDWAKDKKQPRVKTYRHEFVKCGKPSCRKCTKEQGHGPYWYAYWREGDKIRKRYIGKKFKALWELAPATVNQQKGRGS